MGLTSFVECETVVQIAQCWFPSKGDHGPMVRLFKHMFLASFPQLPQRKCRYVISNASTSHFPLRAVLSVVTTVSKLAPTPRRSSEH